MLVVDDDPNILRLVHSGLARADIPAVVSDGENAVDLWDELQTPMVLLDLRLGNGLCGADIARELKSRETPPAIMLISGQPELQRIAAVTLADGVLAKPFDMRELIAMVTSWMGRKSQAV